MKKKILLGVGVVVLAFLGYVAAQPAEYKVSREIKINAPIETVYSYAIDPRKVNAWNPWMKLDPQIKITYSGPEVGVGASSSWEGNSDVGAGSATIIASTPPSLVQTRLDYKKPFESTSNVEFALKTEGAQTVVAWSNSGKSPFFMRIICTLFAHGMDKMIGEMFEKGLADLKTMVEAKK